MALPLLDTPTDATLASWARELLGVSASDLLAVQATVVEERRRADARLAVIAAEIARRSAPDAGLAGMAQHAGDGSAARMIARTTGVDAAEARRLIAVGSRISSAEDPVGAAVASGTLSVASAAGIVAELTPISAVVPVELLHTAARDLVDGSTGLSPAQVRREAREVRDLLHVEGVPDRERRLHERRRLTILPQQDGMTRINGLLDPESAAWVSGAFDQALSPRRGGPRFSDPGDVARAEALERDPRTTEQLMVDTLVDIVRLASGADRGTIFGTAGVAVRIHVSAADLARGSGRAIIEGQQEVASMATAERALCSGGIPVLFDEGGTRILSIGREQRHFTARQRIALAARDGGCIAPGCDRPPASCEAHHIDPWSEGGATDVDRGALLCRRHHRMVHDQGRIVVTSEGFAFERRVTGTRTPWPTRQRVRVGARARPLGPPG